jgi:hypothetical protein
MVVCMFNPLQLKAIVAQRRCLRQGNTILRSTTTQYRIEYVVLVNILSQLNSVLLHS